MECTIQYDDRLGVCVITGTGMLKRPQDSLELLRIAGAYAVKHHCSRFLFDMRETDIVGSTVDAYEIPLHPEKYGIRKSFHIAAVYAVATSNERLLEDVGVNRGATAFRVFDDIDAAHEWLAGLPQSGG
jgi:hypothetical protein